MASIFSNLTQVYKDFREFNNLMRAYRAEGLSAAAAEQKAEMESPARLKDRRTTETRLDAHKQTKTSIIDPMFLSIMQMAKSTDDAPQRGTPERSEWLDKIWRAEPILAGAVYSMVAKMQSMTWRVEGGRNNSKRVANMLSNAQYMGGTDWSGFIAASAEDFYTQDNGVFWDVIREKGSKWGRATDLTAIDSRCCVMTGNANTPMYYASRVTSQELWYKPWQFIHFTSMPSPSELEFGLGTSATSRASRAAKLLLALHNYDEEKLNNLPPEGIATVTGMTSEQFRAAITMWQMEREQNNSLTFPQVLWLVGNNPGSKIDLSIQSFSQIPESYDRQTVVSQYVNTVALDFGVDTREFWAISTGALGTASEAEVQHMKARGKGGGEFISLVERHLNAEIPSNVTFEFDTQDIEEDMVSAEVAKAWVDAYLPLALPTQGGEPVIDQKTLIRLLADKRALPEWVADDDRIAILSGEVHKDEVEDVIRFIWKCGKVLESRILSVPSLRLVQTSAPIMKQERISNVKIRGNPIPDHEVERGARVTRNTISEELRLWQTLPELAPHVPEEMISSA